MNFENSDMWVDNGLKFWNSGDYVKALDAFKNATESTPDNALAWQLKGATLDKLGKHKEALNAFKKSIEHDEKLIDSYIAIVNLFLDRSVINDASNEIKKALKIEPENSNLWFLKGKIALERHDYLDASSFFKTAMSFNLNDKTPLLWDAYARYLYAQLCFSSDSYKAEYQDIIISILRDLEKILDTDDETIKSYTFYFLGYFYNKINDPFSALENLMNCRYHLKKVKKKMKKDKKNYTKDLRKLDRSAELVLSDIWDYHVRPHWWNWWLSAPVKSKRKKLIFFTFLGFILVPLAIHPALSSFSISWNLYILFDFILILILFSPSVSKIKGSEIDIEMQAPPTFEFSAGIIESMLRKT